MRTSWWMFVFAVGVGSTHAAAPGIAPTDAPYESLPGHKAMAVSRNASGRFVERIAFGHPGAVAASMIALRECESARTPDQPPCEIARHGRTRATAGWRILRDAAARGGRPFLWRYEHPLGTLYLAGSLHLMKATLLPLPAAYLQAFDAATRFVAEVDFSRWKPEALSARYRSYSLLPDGQTLHRVLPPETFSRLAAELDRVGIQTRRLADLNPAAVTNELVVAHFASLGYLPGLGVDVTLAGRGTAKTQGGLESLDDQLGVLFGTPLNDQIVLLEETLDQIDDLEPWLSGIVTAWFAGDGDDFMRLFTSQSGESDASRAYLHRVLDERNAHMAVAVEALMDLPGTTFVLVGSAHLLGPQGIVARLGSAGYEGERQRHVTPP